MKIVVSGMSGKFPESENIQEFWENLESGVDMVTENACRWTPGLYNLPTRGGRLKHLDKFDSHFFGIHAKQASSMDPQLRILLELTHEAILDAGVNPRTLRGSNTGVFIGAIISESEEKLNERVEDINGYALLGCSLSMFPNRISFCFDLKGPSFSTDTACSASLQALHQAVTCMRTGHCEAAIVGTSNICLNPKRALNFHRLRMLSPDGKCRAFDASASGYVRSEAAVVIFLQRKQLALRSYAEILHVKTNQDGFTSQGITFPGREAQKLLLEETYAEAGVPVEQVCYIECHGTGTKVGDPEELSAIAEVLCPENKSKSKREFPLYIGSVKSNMGHSEPAAGLCGLVKILLAFQHDLIPANLHFNRPNPEIPSLVDGRLQVVAENRRWPKTGRKNVDDDDDDDDDHDVIIAGLNSFGFGGSNVHVIVKGERPFSPIRPLTPRPGPTLVPIYGRTAQSLEKVLTHLTFENLTQDEERVALLQEIAKESLHGMDFRGFALYSKTGEPITEHQVVKQGKQEKTAGSFGQSEGDKFRVRPLWLIFSGMGSQWEGMGRELMVFPAFQQSIVKSSKILKTQQTDLDLFSILGFDRDGTRDNTSKTKTNSDCHVLKTFVSVVAVQVALVDLLTSLNLRADGMIGHSFGELTSAYADGGLTHEQTVLSAWARGRAILDGQLAPGGMAVVGLTWDEARAQCPPLVFPACNNSRDNVTISGALEPLSNFLEVLKGQKIFVKWVDSCGVPFHSPMMERAGCCLKKMMDEIVPEPKLMSKRWVSTSKVDSVNDKGQGETMWCSAQYFVNNLLSPVRFYEALGKIPEGALVLEVAPHALLLPILKRALTPHQALCLGLQCKRSQDKAQHFLKTMGQLYTAGLNPHMTNIYGPRVPFPVSVRAKSVSPLISWYHEESWTVPSFIDSPVNKPHSKAEGVVTVSLASEENQFYFGHKIDGRFIFPGPGYLVILWSHFSRLCGKKSGVNNDKDLLLPVVFENFVYHRATILQKDQRTIEFHIDIHVGSGHFEIQEGDQTVVSGVIRSLHENGHGHGRELPDPPTTCDLAQDEVPLNKDDIYKIIENRGYEYSGGFQGLQSADNRGRWALVEWRENWVTFLDNFFQLLLLAQKTTSLTLLSHFERLTIDPTRFHKGGVQDNNKRRGEPKVVPVVHEIELDFAHCNGVQLQGVVTTPLAPKQRNQFVMGGQNELSHLLVEHSNIFTPHFDSDPDQGQGQGQGQENSNILEKALSCCVQLVVENSWESKEKALGILLLPSSSCSNSSNLKDRGQFLKTFKRVIQVEENRGTWISVQVKVPQKGVLNDLVAEGREQNLVVVDCLDQLTAEALGQVKNAGFFLLYDADSSSSSFKFKQTVNDMLQQQQQQHPQWTLVAQKKAGSLNQQLLLFRKRSSNEEMPGSWEDVTVAYLYQIMDNVAQHDSDTAHQIREKLVEIGEKSLTKSKSSKVQRILVVHFDGLPTRFQRFFGPQVMWIQNVIFDLRKNYEWGKRLRLLLVSQISHQNLDSHLPKIVSRCKTFLLKTDLVFNVYREKTGVWGSHRQIPIAFDDPNNSYGTNHMLVVPFTKSSEAYLTPLNNNNNKDIWTSFAWVESPPLAHLKHLAAASKIKKENETGNISAQKLCSVHYAPVKFEFKRSIRKRGQELLGNWFGQEYSGHDPTSGQRIMGCVGSSKPWPWPYVTTSLYTDPHLTWPVPESWSLSQASTVPLAYSMAYYALCIRGGMKPGDRLLINLGPQPQGFWDSPLLLVALINVAIAINVNASTKKSCVYVVTCFSNPESHNDNHNDNDNDNDPWTKMKQVLQQSCPGLLPSDSFINVPLQSSTAQRSALILSQLYNKSPGGVNLALLSTSCPFQTYSDSDADLELEHMLTSAQCLVNGGKLLVLDKMPIVSPSKCSNSRLIRRIVEKRLILEDNLESDIFLQENAQDRKMVASLFSTGLNSGVVKPLLPSFLVEVVPWATLVNKQHKLSGLSGSADDGLKNGPLLKVLQIWGDDKQDGEESRTEQTMMICRTYLDPGSLYLLFCWDDSLGGHGTQFTTRLVDWMVSKGARNIMILSPFPTKPTDPSSQSDRDTNTNANLTGFQSYCLRKWGEADVQVAIQMFQISSAFLENNISCPWESVRGVFLSVNLSVNGAGASEPENPRETYTNLRKFARDLDLATRHLENLEHFVILSRNDDGQVVDFQKQVSLSLYLHEICRERVDLHGLPGLAANFGPVTLEMQRFKEPAETAASTTPQDISSVLSLLEHALTANKVHVIGSQKQKQGQCDKGHDDDLDQFARPFVGFSCRLLKNSQNKRLHHHQDQINVNDNDNVNANAFSIKQRKILRNVGRILGFRSDLSAQSMLTSTLLSVTFADLGVDSLMTMELEQFVQTEFAGLRKTDQQIRQMTIQDLVNLCTVYEEKNGPFPLEHQKIPQVEESGSQRQGQGQGQSQSKARPKKEEKIGGDDIEEAVNENGTGRSVRSMPQCPRGGCSTTTTSTTKTTTLLMFCLLVPPLLAIFCLSALIHFGMILLFKIFKSRRVQGVCGNQGFVMSMAQDNPGYNSVTAVKFLGPFHPSTATFLQQFKNMFIERILKYRTNVMTNSTKSETKTKPTSLSMSMSTSTSTSFYAPFDLLFWRWKSNWLFEYWEHVTDFDLNNHVSVDECLGGESLDKTIERAAAKWQNHQWPGDNPQWTIKILVQDDGLEFAVLFVFSRCYGDALSLKQLIEHLLWDKQNVCLSNNSSLERSKYNNNSLINHLNCLEFVHIFKRELEETCGNFVSFFALAKKLIWYIDPAEFVRLHQFLIQKRSNKNHKSPRQLASFWSMTKRTKTKTKLSNNNNHCRTTKMNLSKLLPRNNNINSPSFNAVFTAAAGRTMQQIWKKSLGENAPKRDSQDSLVLRLSHDVSFARGTKMGLQDCSVIGIPISFSNHQDFGDLTTTAAQPSLSKTIETAEKLFEDAKNIRQLSTRLLFKALWARIVRPLRRQVYKVPKRRLVCLTTVPWYRAPVEHEEDESRFSEKVDSNLDWNEAESRARARASGSTLSLCRLFDGVTGIRAFPPNVHNTLGKLVAVVQGPLVTLSWTTYDTVLRKIPQLADDFLPAFEAELDQLNT